MGNQASNNQASNNQDLNNQDYNNPDSKFNELINNLSSSNIPFKLYNIGRNQYIQPSDEGCPGFPRESEDKPITLSNNGEYLYLALLNNTVDRIRDSITRYFNIKLPNRTTEGTCSRHFGMPDEKDGSRIILSQNNRKDNLVTRIGYWFTFEFYNNKLLLKLHNDKFNYYIEARSNSIIGSKNLNYDYYWQIEFKNSDFIKFLDNNEFNELFIEKPYLFKNSIPLSYFKTSNGVFNLNKYLISTGKSASDFDTFEFSEYCNNNSTQIINNKNNTTKKLYDICTDPFICPSTGISKTACANFYSKKCSDEINTNQKTNFFEGYCKQHKSINPSNWANLAWDNICSKGDNIIELPQCKQLFLDTNNAPYSKRDFFDPKLNDICNKKYIPEIREYRILDKDGDEIIEKIQIVIPQYIKEENKSLQYSNKSLVEIENINNKIFLQLYSGGSQQAYEYHIKDMCGCYWTKAILVIVRPNGTIERSEIDLNEYLLEKQYSRIIKDPLIKIPLQQLALCTSKLCLNTTSRLINPFFDKSCSNICIQSSTNTAIDSITGQPIVNQTCKITVNEKKDINEPNIEIKVGMKRNNINRKDILNIPTRINGKDIKEPNIKVGMRRNNINRKDILNIPTRINGKDIKEPNIKVGMRRNNINRKDILNIPTRINGKDIN